MNEKILIFQRTLTHYRLDVFRKLYQKFGVILCFGKKGLKNTFLSTTEPDFPHLKIIDFYPFPKKETFCFLDIFTPLIKYGPDIIIIDFSLLIISNYLLLLLRPFFKYKLILWSHGYNRKKGFKPYNSLADRLRLWWINKADAIILYGQKSKKLIEPYIKDKRKIFVAPNTLNTDKLLAIRNKLERNGKQIIKNELGFKSKYNLIFIGRLLKEKEPDRAIEVFSLVQKKIKNIEFHFIGDGPMKNRLKIMSKNLGISDKVRFWGTITCDEKTGKLLYASDMMVMPGDIGLSIVHSSCFNCPVITQLSNENSPLHHGPEIEYLINGKTGSFVPYGDNKKMTDVIVEYLLDEDKQKKMKKEIRYMVENICSIENMIKGFKEAIEYLSAKTK